MTQIRINAPEWETLDEQVKEQIRSILLETKLLKQSDQIIFDPAAVTQSLPANTVCKAACIAAEAVAIGACALLPTPGDIACIAAARAAGEVCKGTCDSKFPKPSPAPSPSPAPVARKRRPAIAGSRKAKGR